MGGGIRFGEMERDALLAHGAAYLLHDRLHTCSDYTVLPACTRCKSLLTPVPRPLHRTMPGIADPSMESGEHAISCPCYSHLPLHMREFCRLDAYLRSRFPCMFQLGCTSVYPCVCSHTLLSELEGSENAGPW